jgi:thioredoxin reductase (NADPH)
MKFQYLLSLVMLIGCNRSTTDSSPHFNLAKHLTVYHTTEDASSVADFMPVINADQFAKLVKSPEVLMEFYAPWCQACKDLVPELVELHRRHPELPIYRINVDDEAALTKDNEVAFVPTLILFRRGYRAASLSGYNSEAVLEHFLQSDYL